MARMTNAELGRLINRHESYASLLRRDKRTPSTELFVVIVLRFKLDPREAFAALKDGRFGAYLEEVALTKPDRVDHGAHSG
jgi:hypothetical protein